jgi:hypothetical protein
MPAKTNVNEVYVNNHRVVALKFFGHEKLVKMLFKPKSWGEQSKCEPIHFNLNQKV